jgi:hypothetical protein
VITTRIEKILLQDRKRDTTPDNKRHTKRDTRNHRLTTTNGSLRRRKTSSSLSARS